LVPDAVGGVQTTGVSSPYTTRDVAASLVRHVSVAENGVNETVWTSSIDGGGPLGFAGVVVVVLVVVVVVVVVVAVGAGGAAPLGKARNASSRAYGASTLAAAPALVGVSPPLELSASDSPSTPVSRSNPGDELRPVYSPTALTGR
jgi:hypothetical protein